MKWNRSKAGALLALGALLAIVSAAGWSSTRKQGMSIRRSWSMGSDSTAYVVHPKYLKQYANYNEFREDSVAWGSAGYPMLNGVIVRENPATDPTGDSTITFNWAHWNIFTNVTSYWAVDFFCDEAPVFGDDTEGWCSLTLANLGMYAQTGTFGGNRRGISKIRVKGLAADSSESAKRIQFIVTD